MMRTTRRTKTDQSQQPETVEPGTGLDEEQQAQQHRAEAEELRTGTAHARAEADTLLSTARAQAARLVAEAEQRARTLTSQATAEDRRAAELEETARCLTVAHSIRQQITAAEEQAQSLKAEADTLTGQLEGLAGRLAELGEDRENAGAALATAREAGSVETVLQQRAQLAAVDEVTGVLTGQQDTARRRLQAIGEEGWGGEYDRALGSATGLRKQLSDMLDAVDPGRVEARERAVLLSCIDAAKGDVALAAQLAWVALNSAEAVAVLTAPAQVAPGRPRGETVMTVTDPVTGHRVASVIGR